MSVQSAGGHMSSPTSRAYSGKICVYERVFLPLAAVATQQLNSNQADLTNQQFAHKWLNTTRVFRCTTVDDGGVVKHYDGTSDQLLLGQWTVLMTYHDLATPQVKVMYYQGLDGTKYRDVIDYGSSYTASTTAGPWCLFGSATGHDATSEGAKMDWAGVSQVTADPGSTVYDQLIAGTNPMEIDDLRRGRINYVNAGNTTRAVDDQAGGETLTLTGSIVNASTTSGVHMYDIDRLMIVDDTYISQANADGNFGNSTVFHIGATVANSKRRSILRKNITTAGVTQSVVSGDLGINCTTAPANTKDLQICRVTQPLWVPGDGSIGATWNDYYNDGVNPSGTFPWSPSAGGQYTTTGAITIAGGISTGTGWKYHPIGSLAIDAQTNRSGLLDLELKATDGDEAESLAGIGQYASSDHGTAALRPFFDVVTDAGAFVVAGAGKLNLLLV